jgi:hypothetical protein
MSASGGEVSFDDGAWCSTTVEVDGGEDIKGRNGRCISTFQKKPKNEKKVFYQFHTFFCENPIPHLCVLLATTTIRVMNEFSLGA